MQTDDITMTSRFAKGDYYVGDLCFCFNVDDWDEVSDAMEYRKEFETGKYRMGRKRFWWHITALNNQCFEDSNGELCETISNLLGIIPLSCINGQVLMENQSKGYIVGAIVKFEEDFDVWYDNGIFHFGDITIDTNVGWFKK